MSANGILLDVFDISGRGLVVLLEDFRGTGRINDFLLIGSTKLRITGVEMVSYRSVEARENALQKGLQGFSVSGGTKQQIEAYKGQRLQIEPANG